MNNPQRPIKMHSSVYILDDSDAQHDIELSFMTHNTGSVLGHHRDDGPSIYYVDVASFKCNEVEIGTHENWVRYRWSFHNDLYEMKYQSDIEWTISDSVHFDVNIGLEDFRDSNLMNFVEKIRKYRYE